MVDGATAGDELEEFNRRVPTYHTFHPSPPQNNRPLRKLHRTGPPPGARAPRGGGGPGRGAAGGGRGFVKGQG